MRFPPLSYRTGSRRALFAAATVLALAAPGSGALAGPSVEERIRLMERNLAEQSKAIARQLEVLQKQQRELEALKAVRSTAPPGTAANGTAPNGDNGTARGGTRANGQAGAAPPVVRAATPVPPRAPTVAAQRRARQTQQPAASAAAAPATSAPTSSSEPPKRPQVDVEALTDRGGVLTPPGTIIVEPSLEYLHDSGNRVLIEGLSVLPAILIGTIDVRNVERDTLIAATTARAGLTSRFDMDVKVPYVYRRDETTAREIGAMSNEDEVTTVEGHGLGDIEFGGHYQINDGRGGWPYFIGNLRVKTPTGRDPFEVPVNDEGLQTELPTGTGFWGVEPSVSFLLPSPPAVWFGNVKYLWNIERDVGGGFGTIDPGDAVGATLGMGFSVNEKTSLSLGAEYQSVFETRQNGRNVSGTSLQIASGLLGMSYRLNDSVQLNLSTQAGFTDDATDFRALFRVPVTFKVFNSLIPDEEKGS